MSENDILNRLELNVNRASYNIKNNKRKHLKVKNIKNLKIFECILKRVTPYILITSATVGIYKLIGLGYPFVIDNEKIYARKAETLENNKIVTSYTYDYNNVYDNYLIYASKWELKDDSYYRYVYKYPLHYYNEETIFKLLNSNNIRDVLGEPFSTEIEVNDNIIDDRAIIMAIVYDENKNQFRYVKEVEVDNLISTLIIIFTIILFNGILFYKKDLDNEVLTDDINNIKRQYNLLNSEKLLIKKLEIRKNNLNYFNGDENAK